MTISNQTVKGIFTGDGVTTTFAIPFASFSDELSDIVVVLRTGTDYSTETVVNEGVGADEYQIVGSNVVMGTAPLATQKLLVRRGGPLTQLTDLNTYYPSDYVVLERRLDRMCLRLQEAYEQLDRTVKFFPTYDGTLPHAGGLVPEDEKVLGWAGGILTNLDTVDAAALAQIEQNRLDIIDLQNDVATLQVDVAALQMAAQNGRFVLNNAAGATATAIAMDTSVAYSYRLEYEIRRKDDAETRLYSGELHLQFDGTNWVVTEGTKAGVGNPHGVTWGVSTGGATANLTYATDNMTGGNYEGHFTFVQTTFDLTW